MTGAFLLAVSLGWPRRPKQRRWGGQTATGNALASPHPGSTREASISKRSACRTHARCRMRPSSTSGGWSRRSSSNASLAQALGSVDEVPRGCNAGIDDGATVLPRASNAQKSSPLKQAAPAAAPLAAFSSMPTTARRPPVAPAAPRASPASSRSSKQQASSAPSRVTAASAAKVAMRPRRLSPMAVTATVALRPRMPRSCSISRASNFRRVCVFSMSRATS
mmetsp:Transcript_150984/g.263032  ORF Transcript_150984/g.263032 Transcript_150984/m.263032 type:complete len:222 (-) Transcript_150984:953-1618(-)